MLESATSNGGEGVDVPKGFDTDFEIEVLSGCVDDHRFRVAVKRAVGDFDPWSSDALRKIYEEVESLGPGDKLTGKILGRLVDDIDDNDLAEEVGRVGRIVLKQKPASPHYAREKLGKWVRRGQILGGMVRATSAIGDGDIEAAERELSKTARARDVSDEEAGDWLEGFPERQRQREYERDNPDTSRKVPTGFTTLDGHLNGGLASEQLGLIGAYTNIGKSFVAENIAFHGALKGRMTMYVSTEMSKELVDTRLDARAFGWRIDDFVNFDFDEHEIERLNEMREKFERRLACKLWTVSVAQDTLTRQQIELWLDELEFEGRPVELLVVDSGDHMTVRPPIVDVRLRHAQAFADLKRIGDQRKIPVWSTVNATAPSSGRKKEHLLGEYEACGESKDKAKHASVVFTLNQTEAEGVDGIMRGWIAKNRNGPKFKKVWLATDFTRGMVTETDPPDDDDEDDDEDY